MREQTIGTGVDLTAAVTVFVTTVGAPSFAACLAHLRAQDCRARLCIIAEVAPMHAAFQRMLDECRTPFFVQVDEDMLLEPHAVRTLHARIAGAAPDVALAVNDLYDPHLGRCIKGVKIFRHAIARRYPFGDQHDFEVRQVRAIEADGYRVLRTTPGPVPVPGQTLGHHGASWTLPALYERYATLERSRRTTGKVAWFAPYAQEFLTRFQRDPSRENFVALMGVIAGILASRGGPPKAKDFRTYANLPGFAELCAFFDAVTASALPFDTTESDAAAGPCVAGE